MRLVLITGNRQCRFLAASGVEIAQHHRDLIRLRRAAFYSQLKSKVGNIRTKATAYVSTSTSMALLWLHTQSHLPITNFSSLIHFPFLRYPLPPLHLVCARLSPPPALAISLSYHRHPYLFLPPSSRFLRYNEFESSSVHLSLSSFSISRIRTVLYYDVPDLISVCFPFRLFLFLF